MAASQNKGPLKVFRLRNPFKSILLTPLDISANIIYKDGRRQKRELTYGDSFLSQSARFINIGNNISFVEIKNNKGAIRKISWQ